jgi:acyl-CoA reductase-like NAD-dependent aldehyde dehydrogenase
MAKQLITRENPAFPAQIVGQVRQASNTDVRNAIYAADNFFRTWEGTPVYKRCNLLREAVDSLAPAKCEQIYTTLCLELGKPIAASRSELMAAIRLIRHFTEIGPQCLECELVNDDRGRLLINKIPFGAVGAILPWNAPLFVAALKLSPALIAGNTVVMKTSPLAPLAVSMLIDYIKSCLPDGVLQLLHGPGKIGKALVQDHRIRKLSFTGSAAVAREIQAASSNLIRPSLMELGGNDAALILEDAGLTEKDYEHLVQAVFYASGQSCIGCKRIYVPRQNLHEFVENFCHISGRVLRVGNPLKPDVTVGPVVSREVQQRIERMVSLIRANNEGKIVDVGIVTDPAVVSSGYYVQPSIVIGLSSHSPLVRDEQFGPIVPILPYDSLEEAVAEVNSTKYGLGGSVWSSNEKHAFAVASKFQSGVVFVNCHGRLSQMPHASFGGLKESGYGRESGNAGLLEYVQEQSIFMPSSVITQ